MEETPGRESRLWTESRIPIGLWSPASNWCVKARLSTPKRLIHEPDSEFASVSGRYAHFNSRTPAARHSSDPAHATHGGSERHDPHRHCGRRLSRCNLRSGREPVGEKDRRSFVQGYRSSEGENVFAQPARISLCKRRVAGRREEQRRVLLQPSSRPEPGPDRPLTST